MYATQGSGLPREPETLPERACHFVNLCRIPRLDGHGDGERRFRQGEYLALTRRISARRLRAVGHRVCLDETHSEKCSESGVAGAGEREGHEWSQVLGLEFRKDGCHVFVVRLDQRMESVCISRYGCAFLGVSRVASIRRTRSRLDGDRLVAVAVAGPAGGGALDVCWADKIST